MWSKASKWTELTNKIQEICKPPQKKIIKKSQTWTKFDGPRKNQNPKKKQEGTLLQPQKILLGIFLGNRREEEKEKSNEKRKEKKRKERRERPEEIYMWLFGEWMIIWRMKGRAE